MGELFVELFVIIFSIVWNGTLVAAEFSLARIRPSRIEAIDDGSMTIRWTKNALGKLNNYISAAQVGITVSSLALGSVAERMFSRLLDPVLLAFGVSDTLATIISVSLAITIATGVHVVIGEFIPKTLAIQYPERAALGTIIPLELSYKITSPLVALLTFISNKILNLFGIAIENPVLAYSEEEIKYLIEQSHREGVIAASEREMVDNVFEFNDTVAREVMTPRTKIIGLEEHTTVLEASLIATQHRVSRLPVYHDDLDHITGLIHTTDLLRSLHLGKDNDAITTLLRDVLRVPENKTLSALLADFKKNRVQIALVLDEFGGTAGLITLEDIIEEIFGEIRDEREPSGELVQRLNENEYLVDGSLPISQVNEELQTEFSDEDFDTIGGFVFGLIGREAQEGDVVHFGNWTFKVERSESHRIELVKLTRITPSLAPIAEKSEEAGEDSSNDSLDIRTG